MQDLPQSCTADDGRDSDSCNIGSPTVGSVASHGPFSPFGEDRTPCAADSMRGHSGARSPGHMLYRLCGTVEGFKKYLRDAGSLQLLLVSAATVQTPVPLFTTAAEPTGVVQSGGWAPQQLPKQLVSRADEVAVGRVSVSLQGLAALGVAEGARLHLT